MLEAREERVYDVIVRLQLVYYGPVRASGNKPQTSNVHAIRCALSNQIMGFYAKHAPDVMRAGGLSKLDIWRPAIRDSRNAQTPYAL
jgi:hypothetical protein